MPGSFGRRRPRVERGPDPAVQTWVEGLLGTRVREWAPLAGGAGSRRYWRAWPERGPAHILMHALPEDPHILPPALRAGPDPPRPFVETTRLFARHGLPVPEILGVHERSPWVLLEDFGDRHLCDLAGDARSARHREAIDLLTRIHAIPTTELPFPRVFDEAWVRFELDHFLHHALPARARPMLEADVCALSEGVARLRRVLSPRDYQSQNLMIDGADRLRLLDYQDALAAPAELDLVALLHDSYVELDPAERGSLLDRYATRVGRTLDPRAFTLLTVQRKAKDLGRFLYLVHAKDDSRYASAAQTARVALLAALGALDGPLGAAGDRIAQAVRDAQ